MSAHVWRPGRSADWCFACGIDQTDDRSLRACVPIEAMAHPTRPIVQTADVDRPLHYTSHPSGVECITVVEHMGFNLGNAVKYLWRAGLKSPDAVQDLEKAAWYVRREIERLRMKP